jgi:hypothetical protein
MLTKSTPPEPALLWLALNLIFGHVADTNLMRALKE